MKPFATGGLDAAADLLATDVAVINRELVLERSGLSRINELANTPGIRKSSPCDRVLEYFVLRLANNVLPRVKEEI